MGSSEYFEHVADMGVVGRGTTLGEAYEGAAAAMFGLMADLSEVHPRETVRFSFTEPDVELALVVWLNRLLVEARTRGMVFRTFRLRRENDTWHGEASGERWREGLTRGTEVKGATLTALRVGQRDGTWEARCVVDM
ncbi:MAG: archease [Myxococcota bacterium]